MIGRFLQPINLAVGALAGIGLFSAVNMVWWLPAARHDAEARVTAELTANFLEATGDLTDAAEQARARRDFCRDTGRVYDLVEGECR